MIDQSALDEIVSLTCGLVAIPSTDDRPDQLRAVIDYAERYAQAVPGVHIHRAESDGKPGLVVTLRDTQSPAIIFNAHLDVVPARAEQYQPAVRDGRIYGRASQDMKGSGAVLLRLMKDLAALPEPPDVGFMFVSDEEIGGEHGTGYLLNEGWTCGFFLAAEPTDMQICYAQKGAMWVVTRLRGQPAHGSRPWDGVNAIAALEQRYPTPDEPAWVTTVVPTVIHAGDAGNRLPAQVDLTFDIRHVPEEAPEAIVAAIQACFRGSEITLMRCGGPLDTAPDDASVQRLGACITAVTGTPARFYREHFASDARFYSERRIPAVCLGPVGAGLHSDEEWVDIASLGQLYEVLRRFATDE